MSKGAPSHWGGGIGASPSGSSRLVQKPASSAPQPACSQPALWGALPTPHFHIPKRPRGTWDTRTLSSREGKAGRPPHYSPPHPHSQHLLPHPRTCRSRTSSRFAPGISCGSEVPGCCRRSKNPQPAQRRGFSSSDKAHSASGVRKHSSIGRSEKKTNPAPSVK